MLGIKYPDPFSNDHVGYWGPVTATIDWCEENYVVSRYFAEFVNSTTNLSFFILSLLHLYSAIQNRHGTLYILVSIGMGTVGLGSWLFHMTLRYEFQLMDELPMIYVTAIPFGYIYSWQRSPFWKNFVRYGTAIFTVTLTLIYIFVYKNPILHQISYATLNFLIIYKTLKTINERVTDPEVRYLEYKLLALSFSLFGFGFFVWNLDNIFCDTLSYLRRNYLGLPFGFIIEGHGWWHIFTSLGIYYFILYNEIMGTWMNEKPEDYKLVWRMGFLGEMVLTDEAKERYQKLDEKKKQ
ncbi:BA75_04330T0 [Komagataella pastoris]|uniref:BA75_04330T0 n=1 Tax=Komagataella pastoris TaxID=4922 RepID=A0A1B2JH15_PICPA|nr:BA75_04330T0 [Komagataella pastoris]